VKIRDLESCENSQWGKGPRQKWFLIYSIWEEEDAKGPRQISFKQGRCKSKYFKFSLLFLFQVLFSS
jgi:hypothetical protein